MSESLSYGTLKNYFTTKKYIKPFLTKIKFKATYIKNERKFLSEGELQIIIEKKIDIERLDLVKDLFIFSCYTGLSYIDVMNLNEDNITFSINGANG